MRLRDLFRRIDALEAGRGLSAEVFTAVYTFDAFDSEDPTPIGTLSDSTGPLEVDDDDFVAVVDCIIQGSAYPQAFGITGEGYFSFGLAGDAELLGNGGASVSSAGPYVPIPFMLQLLAGQRFRYTAGFADGDAAASGATINIVGTVLI